MRSSFLLCAVAALAVAGCAGETTGPTSDPAPVTRVETVRGDLDELLRAGAVGALATLSDGGRPVTVTAGVANVGTGQPIPVDPPQYVRVGSISKSFVAVLVMQLVDAGKVALDAPVDTYLPGLLTGDGVDGRVITVRQLLSHRSGLPELTDDPEVDENRAAQAGRTFTPAEEVALALRLPAKFPPGSRYEYTNTNYIVAAMLVEQITGRPYVDELRDRILVPLELRNTYLPTAGELDLRDPHPSGYADVDGRRVEASRIEPSVPWAAGGLVSTGADLDRFYSALLDGRVVPPQRLREMLDGGPAGAGVQNYGLGLMYGRLPCGAQFVGHFGGIHGFLAISAATAEGRAATVSMTGSVAESKVDTDRILGHALCP
ncbi:serine hydrolase domain-containing protein [Nocardia blacklockiae]|uniref:serine hydrolase domain-containing protein n=1 Tax=Nocardia blacklockiae TaxID=480036 RepID=UPI0018941C48|nr:serine hydrolase domain-containing protein [Nocardia blacklockiae]MBF6170798.1 beta-lactamase family protein [Nocardia blacklockiae]